MATPKISKAMTGVPGFSKEEIDQFPIGSKLPLRLGTAFRKGSEILIEISTFYFSTWDYNKRG